MEGHSDSAIVAACLPCLRRISPSKKVIFDSATFLAIQLPSRRGSVLDMLRVLERHQAEVMDARIDVRDEKVMTFTATMRLGGDGSSSIDMLRQDILTSLLNIN